MTYGTSFLRNNFLLSPTNNLISSFIDLFQKRCIKVVRRWSLGLDSCHKMQISVSVVPHTNLLSESRLRTFGVFENPSFYSFSLFFSLFLFPFFPPPSFFPSRPLLSFLFTFSLLLLCSKKPFKLFL